MEDAIITEKISKHYGTLKAVDEVSLNVKKGEIYGFLGLNGAGKTTTIRMLLGLINPTKGSAYILGKKVKYSETKLWEKVGYLVESPFSYGQLTVKENLELYAKLHLMNKKNRFKKKEKYDSNGQNTIEKVIDKLKLTKYKDVKAKNLSSGNNQRLGIAKALLHEPEILILDEPINGLDPAGIVEIRQMLLNLSKKEGKTIFISSHILAEISKLADRIGIIHNGKLIKEIDDESLEKERLKSLKVMTNDNLKVCDFLRSKNINVDVDEEGFCRIYDSDFFNNPEKLNLLLCENNLVPKVLMPEIEDLEEYFLRIIGNL